MLMTGATQNKNLASQIYPNMNAKITKLHYQTIINVRKPCALRILQYNVRKSYG